MRKTKVKATSYVYEHLTNVLSKGLRTAIPRDVLEKEGLSVDELSEYFYIRSEIEHCNDYATIIKETKK